MFSNITITDIKETFTVFSHKGRFEKIENRKSFGLSFCIDGQITYTHNGNKIISDKNHTVILPKGQTYTLHGDKTGSFPVINFTCADALCNTVISLPVQNIEAYIKYRQIEDKKVRETIDFLLNREEAHNQMFRDAFNEVQESGSNRDFGTTKAARMYFSLSNPRPNAFAGNEVTAPKFKN